MTFEEHWAKMQGTQNAAVEMGKTVVEIMKEAAESGWKAGQEAMRERAAQTVDDTPKMMAGLLSDKIRALPIE